ALLDGYDQAAEDQLFKRIRWPSDGYRLFEIGHFIGDRDWFDGIVESNCVFVPRDLVERYGGFDESFSVPGGGDADLQLYEGKCAVPPTPGARLPGRGTVPPVHRGGPTHSTD